MVEFSDNMGLVADVYISTRRLEGVAYELTFTLDRIKKLAQAWRCSSLFSGRQPFDMAAV